MRCRCSSDTQVLSSFFMFSLFFPSTLLLSQTFCRSSYLSIDGSNFPNQLQMLLKRDRLWHPTDKSASQHEKGSKPYMDLMVCTKKFSHSWRGGGFFYYILLKSFGFDSRHIHGGGGGSWGRRVDFFMLLLAASSETFKKKNKIALPDCDCCWLLTYVRLLSFHSSWQVHAEPPGSPTWPVIS